MVSNRPAAFSKKRFEVPDAATREIFPLLPFAVLSLFTTKEPDEALRATFLLVFSFFAMAPDVSSDRGGRKGERHHELENVLRQAPRGTEHAERPHGQAGRG